MTIFEWCDKHPGERLRFGYSDDCGVIVYNASVEDLDEEDIIELGKFVLSRYRNVELMFYKPDNLPFSIEVILKKSSVLSKDLHYTHTLDPNIESVYQVLNILAYAKEKIVNFIFGG